MTDCPDFTTAPPNIADALAAPSGDILLPAILQTRPRGPAWQTDETDDGANQSFMHKFWRAVCDPIADCYAKAWQLALESTACTVDADGIDDWEREYGLPDACLTPSTDLPTRLKRLRGKVYGQGGQTAEYLICLAQSLGYTVTIEEPKWFAIGDPLCDTDAATFYAINPRGYNKPIVDRCPIFFEVGYSAIGDRLLDFPLRLPAWFIVHIQGATYTRFEIGYSAAGDRLIDFTIDADLECVIRRDAPAHTTPVFDYSGKAITDGI